MAPAEASHYVPRLLIALLSLVPYILVASGSAFYGPQVMHDIGTTQGAMSIIEALGTAGYAFGALLGGDLINRFQQRHMFMAGQCVFMLGWLLIATAGNVIGYGAGRVLAGLSTGTLLVTALPPVMRQFPVERLPITTAFINLGLFGAIAAGPLLGGAVAAGHLWRAIYGGFAGIGLINLLIALCVLPKIDPPNPDLRFDVSGLTLGFFGCVLPFFASGELRSHGFGEFSVAVPLGVGLVCFLALMLAEYHQREPLSPVAKMWTTIPLTGTLIAMVGGGAFVTFVLLTAQYLLKGEGRAPLAAGLTFWPQVIGTVVTAVALGVVFRTRFLALLAFGGMVLLSVGGTLLALNVQHSTVELSAGLGLLGLGAGATVSPGLFLAGLSLPAQLLGRIFALVELVRSVADFIMAPVIQRIATVASGTQHLTPFGYQQALWITLSIAVAGTLFAAVLYLLGGAGLTRPDIEGWLHRNRSAVRSPPLLARLRAKAPPD